MTPPPRDAATSGNGRRLEKGGWKYDELERLAQALNMTVDELITENHTDGANK